MSCWPFPRCSVRVGAYHPALRVAKVHFKDKLERSGLPTAPALWTVAYPTGLVPTIAAQGVTAVDPYLAAAIIREESQYDEKAVSVVGAVGLMQLMPVTVMPWLSGMAFHCRSGRIVRSGDEYSPGVPLPGAVARAIRWEPRPCRGGIQCRTDRRE